MFDRPNLINRLLSFTNSNPYISCKICSFVHLSFAYSVYESCKDESMLSLQEKCSQLEDDNTSLILEVRMNIF